MVKMRHSHHNFCGLFGIQAEGNSTLSQACSAGSIAAAYQYHPTSSNGSK
jgi:hypothetical protein